MKRNIALLLAMVMGLMLCACGKSDAAIACENLINSIGEVTLDSKDAIEAAEEAYSALNDEEKESISESKEILTNSRILYENAVMNSNVGNVIAAINDIRRVTLDAKELVSKAREMYDALNEAEKKLVDNYSLLTAAEEDYSELVKEEKKKAIERLLPKFNVVADRVINSTIYNPIALPEYANEKIYVIPYISIQNGNIWMIVRYNYTDKDWISLQSLSIMADEKRNTIKPAYNNIKRGGNYGEIAEVYDQIIAANSSLEHPDIQMVKAMGDAKETIVRFQGNLTHYNHTLSSAEKEAMRDVWELYSALIW